MTELTIRQAQQSQPWTVPYSKGVEAAAELVPHIYASHTVLHAMKTVGKLAAVFEHLDHFGRTPDADGTRHKVAEMAADLVTAALRLANLYGFDLSDELERRVVEKNGVGFREVPT